MRKVILLVIFALSLSGCSKDQNDQVTLMLDYTPNTNHSGIYVADKLGYYDDAGIDLTIMQPGETQIEPLVANQKVDFAISYEDQVNSAINNNVGIKAIATITNGSTTGPVSRADRNLKTPADWSGATYCGWGAPIEDYYIDQFAEKYNVDPKTINHTESNQTFLADTNTCDIFWGYTTWELIEASQSGIKYDYIPASQIADYYPVVIITSDKLIDKNPDLVQRFMTATAKGYQYASANPEKATDIFLDANPEYDQQLIAESQKFISPLYVNEAGKFGIIDDQVWTNFTDFMISGGLVDEKQREKMNSGYTNKFLEE